MKGTPMKDIRLTDHGDWQKRHWRSIESAYNSSPFFEYYRDELERIYQKDYNYLIDFNMDLENCILELLEYYDLDFYLSSSYIEVTKNNEFDLRNEIVPKKKGLYLHNNLKVPYYQVFQSSEGFSADLSILDLLFNMGNESRIYLKTI